MVSRRTFFTITVMMTILFFLFVFSGVVKEELNTYDTNQYVKESVQTKADMWKAASDANAEIVLFCNSKNKELGRIVRQWCTYSKRALRIYETLDGYELPEKDRPGLLLIDSGALDFNRDIEKLQGFVNEDMNLVFCNLPDTAIIEQHPDFAGILGIQSVLLQTVRLEGVELFDGFLLGGHAIYKAENAKEEEQQDFDMDVPWFQTTSGTKTYMTGMLEREDLENEYLPALIWRNSIGGAKIFAINADFMQKAEGVGILSAIMTECKDYDVYPVVNAQNMTLANFPGLSAENNEEMMRIYSRNQPTLFKEVVQPGLQAVFEKSKDVMTCLLMVEYDYEDEIKPVDSDLVYYLKILREQNAEAGLSGVRKDDVISLKEKIQEDRRYFLSQFSRYTVSAYYMDKKDIEEAAAMGGSTDAPEMRTITTDFNEESDILSYAAEDVTLQTATIDGFSHTYHEDFRVKSIETALGYSNILADMKRISWPESEEDRWEKLSEDFSRYTTTHWQAFSAFEKVALSESDRRVRNFLSLDYGTSREENTIFLDVENSKGTSYFILRTHDEEIEEIKDGSFEKIEEDAYLISTKKSHVEITLKQTFNDSYFFME